MATPARVVSLPLPLLAEQPLPLARYPSAQCRLRQGGEANKAPPPLVAAKTVRGLIAVRCSVEAAVPRSVPVRVAYELQQAGHRYLTSEPRASSLLDIQKEP